MLSRVILYQWLLDDFHCHFNLTNMNVDLHKWLYDTFWFPLINKWYMQTIKGSESTAR